MSAEGWLLLAISGAQEDHDVRLLCGLVGVLDATPSPKIVNLIRLIAGLLDDSGLILRWRMPTAGPIYPLTLPERARSFVELDASNMEGLFSQTNGAAH